MPNKAPATRTFAEPYTTESKNPLPASDDDMLAALASYGAEYTIGPSNPRKAERKELLAGLSWLHLIHDDVAAALRCISRVQQMTLTSALEPDFQALGGQTRWPIILGRAICAHALPGDTPTKRKPKRPDPSRAEKHLHRTTTMTWTESPWTAKPKTSSPQLRLLRRRRRRSRPKGPAPASRSSSPEPSPAKRKLKKAKPPASSSPSPEPASPQAPKKSEHSTSKSASSSSNLPPMPGSYEDNAASRALADQLCALPWLPSTALANGLPAKFRRVLYLGGNLNHPLRRDYDRPAAPAAPPILPPPWAAGHPPGRRPSSNRRC